jgi:hypothetical protein
MMPISAIESIGDPSARRLEAAGIRTTGALLDRGATAKGRQEIARETGISERLLLRWVKYADLFRVNGVASQWAELLEAAGVDTTRALAQRNAEHLHDKLVTINRQRKLVPSVPSVMQVRNWVEQAKQIPGWPES